MHIPAEYIVATAEESRQVDSSTIDSFGIDEFTLMEVAGLSAAKHIRGEVQPGSLGVLLCGKGNNGGDALVVARYLCQHAIECTLVFIAGDDDLSETAQKNYELLQLVAENDENASVTFKKSWDDFDTHSACDFIIDGMLGTGLDSDLRGDYPAAVEWANQSESAVYAMDIPTGLNSDSGKIMGSAVEATQTFAFGVLKQGFYMGEGPAITGAVTFCELPFPDYIKQENHTYLIDEAWVPELPDDPAAHKYEAGVVYIIAGSEGMTGAAIMASKSAWAEGAGAVMLVCPRGLLHVYESVLPQIIKKPVGDASDFFFKKDHLDDVSEIVQEKPGPVVIGPGMGRNDTTVDFAASFLAGFEGEAVIDADALWALAQQDNWNKPAGASWILTPHPGELRTLLDKDVSDDAGRLQEVRNLANDQDITVLSKGFPVLLGTPSGNIYFTGYDTRIFSRAGFGDVLAGKIAFYRSKKMTPEISCCRALLNGFDKVQLLQRNHQNNVIPEPFDLI